MQHGLPPEIKQFDVINENDTVKIIEMAAQRPFAEG